VTVVEKGVCPQINDMTGWVIRVLLRLLLGMLKLQPSQAFEAQPHLAPQLSRVIYTGPIKDLWEACLIIHRWGRVIATRWAVLWPGHH